MPAMNAPHLHLLVNHAPVFGSVFAALLLVWALVRRSSDVRRIALAGAVVVGLAAVPAYFTGEPAEKAIARMEGVERKRIHVHEEAAMFGLISAGLTGLVALGSLVAFRRKEPATGVIVLVLVLDLWAVSVFTRVAYLGGQIRHPEIRAGTVLAPADSAADRD
jgi:hypothetical protein